MLLVRDGAHTSLIVYSEQAFHGSRIGKGRPAGSQISNTSRLPTQHDLPIASPDELVVPEKVSSTMSKSHLPLRESHLCHGTDAVVGLESAPLKTAKEILPDSHVSDHVKSPPLPGFRNPGNFSRMLTLKKTVGC